MRFFAFSAACALLALFALMEVGDAQDKKAVKPLHRWTGKINDNEAKKVLPKNGFIIDGKTFAELWKGWRKDDKLPEIDFTKQIVLVHTAGGPNIPSSSYS